VEGFRPPSLPRKTVNTKDSALNAESFFYVFNMGCQPKGSKRSKVDDCFKVCWLVGGDYFGLSSDAYRPYQTGVAFIPQAYPSSVVSSIFTFVLHQYELHVVGFSSHRFPLKVIKLH
jgi:hypothetical protein